MPRLHLHATVLASAGAERSSHREPVLVGTRGGRTNDSSILTAYTARAQQRKDAHGNCRLHRPRSPYLHSWPAGWESINATQPLGGVERNGNAARRGSHSKPGGGCKRRRLKGRVYSPSGVATCIQAVTQVRRIPFDSCRRAPGRHRGCYLGQGHKAMWETNGKFPTAPPQPRAPAVDPELLAGGEARMRFGGVEAKSQVGVERMPANVAGAW